VSVNETAASQQLSGSRYLGAADEGFWSAWLGKLLFSLISVKVWGLVAATAVSTWLVQHGSGTETYISAAQWLAFNSTVWGIIFGMKEVFRVVESREDADLAIADTEASVNKEATRLRTTAVTSGIAALESRARRAASKVHVINEQGKEVVGDEPDK